MINIKNDNKEIRRITIIGFVVNAILSLGKLLAGFFGRSAAMIADGVHSLSDFLTDIVVLVGIKFTSQPADECHNYGHEKYETLATAVISIFLIIVGFEIAKNGVNNIISAINGEIIAVPKPITLIAAGASIIVKELLYRYTMLVSKKLKSNVLKANAWHHRSDAFSSIGTLIGISGAIFLGSKWAILDPIASVIVSVFIFKVAYQILKPAVDELMEKALPEEEKIKIEHILKENEIIKGYHHLRTRSLGRKAVVEVHIFLDKELNVIDSHEIASNIEDRIRQLYDNSAVITIHVEPFNKKYEVK